MDRKSYIKGILGLSVFGTLFSGYLSYNELVKTCNVGCSAAGTIFGLPPCVYGFTMYLIISVLAWLAFTAKK